MKVSLVVNFEKENSIDIAKATAELLYSNNVCVYSDVDTVNKLDLTFIKAVDNKFSVCDVIVAIGGDGTIIHTSKQATMFSKPILGINSGRIGYLAAVECSELHNIIKIIAGDYCIDERIMLDITLFSNSKKTTYTALNDAVICKGSLSRMIDMEVDIENHPLRYRADGLIVSTPTGSTAYSLSAGGPLLHPRLDNILLTPICPYAYITKAMVVPSTTDVVISVDIDNEKEAYLTVDGEVAVKIARYDKIKISRSDTTVKLIRLKSESIFDRLNNKNIQ